MKICEEHTDASDEDTCPSWKVQGGNVLRDGATSGFISHVGAVNAAKPFVLPYTSAWEAPGRLRDLQRVFHPVCRLDRTWGSETFSAACSIEKSSRKGTTIPSSG